MSSTISALTSGGGIALAGDTSGQLELKTNNGTTAVTIDTSQTVSTAGKLLVGSSSNPFSGLLYVTGTPTSNQPIFSAYSQGGANVCGIGLYNDAASVGIWAQSGALTFRTNGSLASGSETMRIDSSGNLLIGTTSTPNGTSVYGSAFTNNGDGRRSLIMATSTTATRALQEFYNPNGNVGSIYTSGTATGYATSSDYRLKENVSPMSGALAKVSALKPCTYTWKTDGSDGEGFIAHELAEVCPQAVMGEKDAVKEDGTPQYQAIDSSFLVATLTAAIQELNAKVTALEEQVINLGVK